MFYSTCRKNSYFTCTDLIRKWPVKFNWENELVWYWVYHISFYRITSQNTITTVV